MTADQMLLLPRASWEIELAPISRVTLRRECRKENGTDALLSKDATWKMGMVERNLCLQMLYPSCLNKKKLPLKIVPLLLTIMCNNCTTHEK